MRGVPHGVLVLALVPEDAAVVVSLGEAVVVLLGVHAAASPADMAMFLVDMVLAAFLADVALAASPVVVKMAEFPAGVEAAPLEVELPADSDAKVVVLLGKIANVLLGVGGAAFPVDAEVVAFLVDAKVAAVSVA
jgi:hypothetical protein